MKKFILPFAVVALALSFAGVTGAAAQTGTASSVDGFLVGDRGGAHQEWTLSVPANTDVTVSVEYAPCAPPNAVSFVAYSSDGQVARARQVGHCRKLAAWNTASSDSVTLKLSYYEHGMVIYYVVNAEGIVLAPVAPPAVAVEEAAEPAAVEEAEVVEVVEAAPAPVVVVGDRVEGTVLGTRGGGHVKYEVNLTAGQLYSGLMNYHLDAGGVWPAVGFTVWGPHGRVVAQSKAMHGSPAVVDFVASVTGKYYVNVYNYHPGRTLMFDITGLPIAAMAAE